MHEVVTVVCFCRLCHYDDCFNIEKFSACEEIYTYVGPFLVTVVLYIHICGIPRALSGGRGIWAFEYDLVIRLEASLPFAVSSSCLLVCCRKDHCRTLVQFVLYRKRS